MLDNFCALRKWVAPMTQPNKRYKIGHYGSGTSSCLNTQRAIYILFNTIRIAKSLPDTPLARKWVLLEPGWKVTPSGGPAVLVQHGDSDGVLVSLHGEMDRYRRLGTGTRQPITGL
jgi:hypothetical protein